MIEGRESWEIKRTVYLQIAATCLRWDERHCAIANLTPEEGAQRAIDEANKVIAEHGVPSPTAISDAGVSLATLTGFEIEGIEFKDRENAAQMALEIAEQGRAR